MKGADFYCIYQIKPQDCYSILTTYTLLGCLL